MLGSITCDTPIDDILKITEIDEYLNSFDMAITSYDNNIIENTIVSEINGGGLAENNAFTVDDEAPLNIKAQAIVDEFNVVKADTADFKAKITAAALEQKEAEVNKLKLKVSEKIEELKQKRYSVFIESVSDVAKDITSIRSEYRDFKAEMASIDEQIKFYEEKYEQVCSL